MTHRITGILAAAVLTPLLAVAGTVQFNTLPAGGILATTNAGSTVGWGYHLDVTLGANEFFEALGVSDSGFPSGLGTPDSSIFDYPIISASGVTDVSWVQDTAGLYQFVWDSGAFGETVSGNFTLTGRFWTGTPYDDGSIAGQEFSLDAAFTSSTFALAAPEEPTVPEPGTFYLLAGAASILVVGARRVSKT